MGYLEGLPRGNPKSCVCLAMNESGQWEGIEPSGWQDVLLTRELISVVKWD